ncbi:MAG: triose-phosphate isomerase [Sinobacterium sp.]|nr:triose-phosphate isomerase [Sinobacterium sp.]
MARSLVIGNWKMFGSLDFNQALIEDLAEGLPVLAQATVAICPPSIYLSQIFVELDSHELPILLGAQNVCAQNSVEGAYTGEVSAKMLKDLDVSYGLVGHSERREYYKESDAVVLNKFKQLQQESITPVLCVGESLAQRESGEAQAVIAYEPIWAIGTGKTASPEQAQEMHQFIRGLLKAKSADLAENTSLLYGGSVKPDNAVELFAKKDIDGALVGGASLKAEQFIAVCKAAEAA